jgi:acetylornithine deacetylase
MIDLLRELVAIPSANPSLCGNTYDEQALSEFVCDWLRSAGIEVLVQPCVGKRSNVIGVLRGQLSGPTLVLTAHLDTVFTEETGASPRYQDGRLFGCGVLDCKAGLASIMSVAARISIASSLSGTLIIAAVIDEEHSSAGTRAFLKDFKFDAAIVCEPSGASIGVRHDGSMLCLLEASNVGTLQRILVAACNEGLRIKAKLSGVPSFQTQLACRIVSATECDLNADFATLVETVQRFVMAGESASCKLLETRPAFCAPLNSKIITLFQDAFTTVRRVEPALSELEGWTDAALFAADGIPTLVFGPTGGNAHATGEWVSIADVESCTNILEVFARRFCCPEDL